MWDYFYLLKFLILFTSPMRNSTSRMLYFSDFPSIHDIQGLWRPSGHERSTWWEAHSHQKVKRTAVKGLWCVLPACQPPHPHFTLLSPLAEELQSLPQGHRLLTHQEAVPRTKVLLKLPHPSQQIRSPLHHQKAFGNTTKDMVQPPSSLECSIISSLASRALQGVEILFLLLQHPESHRHSSLKHPG